MKRCVTLLTSCLKSIVPLLFVLLLSFSLDRAPVLAAVTQLSPAPETAHTYLISPRDGDTVGRDFAVKFGLSGMGIAPAGINKDNTGHHHLLIDVAELPDLTEPLPATEQIRHFGGGQTETQLSLAPGEHSLQLVLGNYSHVPHDHPVVSERVMITVE